MHAILNQLARGFANKQSTKEKKRKKRKASKCQKNLGSLKNSIDLSNWKTEIFKKDLRNPSSSSSSQGRIWGNAP